MTTTADTFAAFLDVLAETLDLGSEERAQRLHLFRFHLGRVVAATGDEPPERMRRRLLLERAAYRLVTSDDTPPGPGSRVRAGCTSTRPGASGCRPHER